MKYFAIFSGMIAVLLISGFVPQAFAADMSAFVSPDRNKAEANFLGVKNLTIRYPAGSSLAQAFDGKNERITINVNGTDAQNLVQQANRALLESNSPVQITSASAIYTGVLRGGPTSAILSFKVELHPAMEKVVLQRGEGGASGHIVDLEFRHFVVTGPVVVNSQQYGEFNINQPIGLLEELHPDIAQKLESSQAKEIVESPVMDFSQFNAPLRNWHFLFDPIGSYGGAVGLEEEARALSVYSLGESSFREGTHTVEEEKATVNIDGSEARIELQTPPPSGQLTIAGFSKIEEADGSEFAVVTTDAPEGQTATGGFPIQVLLVFGGMMGAIAIFVLIRARK